MDSFRTSLWDYSAAITHEGRKGFSSLLVTGYQFNRQPATENRLQRSELLLRIRARIDLRIRGSDAAVFVDEIRNPLRVLVLGRARRAVCNADLPVGVAEQREGKFVFLREFRVVLRLVEAGAEDLHVFRLVVVVEVPEPGTFGSSARRVGFGEEPQQHLFSAEVAKL